MWTAITFIVIGILAFVIWGVTQDDIKASSKPHGMKLDALAKYLKVKFTHVPESYKCDPIKKEAPKTAVVV